MPWRDWRCIKSGRRWANPEGLWRGQSRGSLAKRVPVHFQSSPVHDQSASGVQGPSVRSKPCSPWTTREGRGKGEGGPEIDHVSLPQCSSLCRVSSRLESAPTTPVTLSSFLLPNSPPSRHLLPPPQSRTNTTQIRNTGPSSPLDAHKRRPVASPQRPSRPSITALPEAVWPPPLANPPTPSFPATAETTLLTSLTCPHNSTLERIRQCHSRCPEIRPPKRGRVSLRGIEPWTRRRRSLPLCCEFALNPFWHIFFSASFFSFPSRRRRPVWSCARVIPPSLLPFILISFRLLPFRLRSDASNFISSSSSHVCVLLLYPLQPFPHRPLGRAASNGCS